MSSRVKPGARFQVRYAGVVPCPPDVSANLLTQSHAIGTDLELRTEKSNDQLPRIETVSRNVSQMRTQATSEITQMMQFCRFLASELLSNGITFFVGSRRDVL
jgi:hypothetical protein